ncbi:hypothetical protein AB0945_29355 [Streptomyces sp. NPDC005474]|uniref:hypothetical protein n=1 Tax=Streptomyces sp. NPDC005474 TaxID=3154878 RepID=UPI00345143EC
MTMTLAVYRLNRETGARTLVRAKHTVQPARIPELGQKCPPYICPRCRSGAADQWPEEAP